MKYETHMGGTYFYYKDEYLRNWEVTPDEVVAHRD